MSDAPREELTVLLQAAFAGDSHAAERILPLVYDDLLSLARRGMQAERAGHTLQPTALVHEAYMRLVGKELSWENRRHFFAAAAQAMRRILVERARRGQRPKHGGSRKRLTLDEQILEPEDQSAEVLALDDVLNDLARLDERKYEVVMLRYFAGLTIEDTAAALSVSPATVKNDWSFARAWLLKGMAE